MIRRLSSGGAFEKRAGYCRAVRAGPLISVSGCAALDESGRVTTYDTYEQTGTALGIGIAAIAELGGSSGDVIRTRLFLAPNADWKSAVKAHGELFVDAPPANTTLFVAGFIPEGVVVEVELDAYVTESGIDD
jgi:enamine deaminase RidA (YjgF/YER057c/UK114 family)